MATVAQVTRCGTNHVMGCPCIYCAEIARLAAENRRMREALGLYADKRNWEPNAIDIGVGNLPEPGSERILQDGGEIARRTLTQPHTAREVARVKALEAVAEAARANVNGEDDGRPEYDLAAKVADLDRGGKGK